MNKPIITLPEFAESVSKSIPYIYEAIANPVEGTMLTVIKEWSDFLNTKKEAIHDFRNVIIDSIVVLEKPFGTILSYMHIILMVPKRQRRKCMQ